MRIDINKYKESIIIIVEIIAIIIVLSLLLN